MATRSVVCRLHCLSFAAQAMNGWQAMNRSRSATNGSGTSGAIICKSEMEANEHGAEQKGNDFTLSLVVTRLTTTVHESCVFCSVSLACLRLPLLLPSLLSRIPSVTRQLYVPA